MESNEASDNNGSPRAFSNLIKSLSQIATRRSRQDVLSSFCDKYLNFFLSQQVAMNASPEAMFDVLAQAVDIREKLHDIERRMDKEHFTELLVGGYFAYGGIDKKESIPICWTRSGLVEHESKSSEAGNSKYSARSPRTLAYLRAQIFFHEIAQAQTLSRTDKPIYAVYMNERDRRVIDFNPSLSKELLRMATALFPAQSPRHVIVAGGIFGQTLFRMMKTWWPRMNLEAYDIVAADEVHTFVEEPNDVPAFFLGDGRGRVPSCTNRRHLWCYERCLQDKGKITTRDVFNPGPWLYPEEATAAEEDNRRDEGSSSQATEGSEFLTHSECLGAGLATIRENSGDNEW